MDESVNVHYAKTHLSALLKRVQAGEHITIAHDGKAIARLVPVELGERRRPGGFSFNVGEEFFDPLPDEDLHAWEK